METFCASSTTPQKFRHNLSSNFYHNVPCSRTIRPISSKYAMPSCNRRSTVSTHSLWQERLSPRSCVERQHAKGRFCSVALAVAAFVVLVVVLSIAGLALYMGALHTESSISLLQFSCSAKLLRGDRFIGALQEKALRYRMQLETLYQRSILGSALISCNVEKFGNDTLTIYFRLGFNKRKVTRNITTMEKLIKDILLTDVISQKPVFKNIRFDPKNVQVKQHLDIEKTYQSIPSKIKELKPKTSGGVILKTPLQNTTLVTNLPINKKKTLIQETEMKESDLPIIQGSFKISKTEADISEKKPETTTTKPKITEKLTTLTSKRSTLKETSVTSALYKIAAIEKVKKSSIINASTTINPLLNITTTLTTPKVTTAAPPNSPLFIINPHLFDVEPWIPIVPESQSTSSAPSFKNNEPVYTAFTNPVLSFHSLNIEPLGSTSIKSHPIPVNKIPTITEPTFPTTREDTSFVEIKTVRYPSSNKHQQQILKNLSAIFHDLASSLGSSSLLPNFSNNYNKDSKEELSLGQGQVEVVEDEESLLQTTKLPLVTLIPVKSNSGIGRPLRRRPINDSLIENRSFPGPNRFNILGDASKLMETEVVTSISSEINKVKLDKNQLEEFKIISILNFATETTVDRNAKMEPTPKPTSDKVIIFATNSTISSTSRKDANLNILTPEKIKQLSEISKISENITMTDDELIAISTKAISSSYSVNHSGFKILTKNFNKVNELPKKTKINSYSYVDFTTYSNSTECGNYTIKCGNGQCLPETTKCNQLIDCNDGKDEQGCNCADYLRSQYLLRKICDGVVDCWDYSDENQCEWCNPDQYVCGNSKVCIDKNKICDGLRDCPQGDDEQQCVTIAYDTKTANEFPYYSEGFLMVRKFGKWGKLCVDNFQNVIERSQNSWKISDLGKAVCKAMTYQNLDIIANIVETDQESDKKYFELSFSLNKTKSNLAFKETQCDSKKIVKVKCESLECGTRPQAVKHIARIVGGGNAGLGSWPWQAALYKEGEFQCGATLLSDRWLVSAGHCFYHSLEEHWVARIGALRRGTALPSPYEQLRPIVRIIVHPGYVDSGFINDISLIQMEFPVVFSDYVRPICLPQLEQQALDGRLCTVVGWGQLFEVGRIFPDTLQEVQVPVISTAECRKRTVFLPLYRITDDMFCAGYERGGRDACLGDSGGPLMCPESNGKWVLQGITSNGYGCARANRPGVYTKVASYVGWIKSTMSYDTYNNTVQKKSVCLGHRCPLGECLPKSRLCNGYIECSDGSDENNC